MSTTLTILTLCITAFQACCQSGSFCVVSDLLDKIGMFKHSPNEHYGTLKTLSSHSADEANQHLVNLSLCCSITQF